MSTTAGHFDPQPQRMEFGQFEREVSVSASRPLMVEERRDEIKATLLQRFERASSSVLSLDVFDTLLLRNDKSEAQRYYEIAERAADAHTHGPSVDDFYMSRYFGMETSYRAQREVDSCREGNLREVIRSQMAQLRLEGSSFDKLMAVEIDYEVENLHPNLALIDLGRAVKEGGADVVLLSDMYLDGEMIRTIARRVIGDMEFIDSIYSSADVILSKRSGRIFGFLEEQTGQPCEAFFHIGDNRIADVMRPSQAGWRSTHFPVSEAEERRRSESLANMKTRMKDRDLDVARWAKI